jgi:hypothetical protein
MRRTLKATLFVVTGTSVLTVTVAIIAVSIAHPSRSEAIQAILGSLGLGILFGSLSFPVLWLFFKGIIKINK